MKEIKVSILRESAKLPKREHTTDAGADVFYAPSWFDAPAVKILPGETKVLETGIKLEVPPGFMVEVKNKSSIAAKKHLLVGACVVDSGYSGELFVNLHNVGKEPQIIKSGQKIAQIVVIPIETPNFIEVEEDELYKNMKSERGEGAFGSTGDK